MLLLTVWLFALLFAPLLHGVVQSAKARHQGRHGPWPWQPYFTLWKLFRRQGLPRPEFASSVFEFAPVLAFAASAMALAAVPLSGWQPAWPGGDLLIVVFLLALERYVLALAGLDTGTPFGGMGSSRSLLVGAFIEPTLFACVLPWMVLAGTTAWPGLIAAAQSQGLFAVSKLLDGVALFVVLLAESGRLPVDNPDTHLELTMIQEAGALEYSGSALALVQWGHAVKQLTVIALGVALIGGGPRTPSLTAVMIAVAEWLVVALALASVESFSVKLRIFRVPAYLGTSAALAGAAAILGLWGAAS